MSELEQYLKLTRRFLFPLLSALAVLGLIYLSVHHRADSIPTPTDIAGWAPSPSVIQQEVDTARLKSNSKDSAELRSIFIMDFQKRYRSNGLAVAVRFGPQGKVRLMCGATVPRWQMARIAMSLHSELVAIFGSVGDIDLYVTYIIKQFQHIGLLRQIAPGKPLQIVFDREVREDL